MNEKELLELKQRIERSQDKINQLLGQKKALMTSLKEEFNCDSVKEAEEAVKKYAKTIDELVTEIEKLSDDIEKIMQ